MSSLKQAYTREGKAAGESKRTYCSTDDWHAQHTLHTARGYKEVCAHAHVQLRELLVEGLRLGVCQRAHSTKRKWMSVSLISTTTRYWVRLLFVYVCTCHIWHPAALSAAAVAASLARLLSRRPSLCHLFYHRLIYVAYPH